MTKESLNKFLELNITNLDYSDHIINGVETENNTEFHNLYFDLFDDYIQMVYDLLDIIQIERDEIEFNSFTKDKNNNVWAAWYQVDNKIKINSDDYNKNVWAFLKEFLHIEDYRLLMKRYETEQMYINEPKASNFNYIGYDCECSFIIEDWIGNIIEVSDSLVYLLEMQEEEPESDLTIYYIDCLGNAKAPII